MSTEGNKTKEEIDLKNKEKKEQLILEQERLKNTYKIIKFYSFFFFFFLQNLNRHDAKNPLKNFKYLIFTITFYFLKLRTTTIKMNQKLKSSR